ncbi:hypothetical protein N7541_005096 [Penicillium brevicompactum]|uniref:LPS glycosyltransferase n=1 Tax=Penicillium brevicompactum TaxID=5074 RepID=A0A9W9UUG3_PENBR|nr:hypothetical protein N7541_005096 [Penicillium brevicompactum]
MPLSAPQKRLLRLFLYATGILALVCVLWPLPQSRGTARGARGGTRAHLDAIRNGTLGVETIYGINIRSRPDKRDTLILGSAVSDFHMEWIDAVTPDQINAKTYPSNWNYDHEPAEYAARRSHLNAMQRIVDERISTAIVMEDDADWDVSIKTQLQSFAIAARALQETGLNRTFSPYGDDWDVLWLGHCGVECRTDAPHVLTHQDPTILPPHHFLPYWRDPPSIQRPDDSRLTCTASDAVCSIVYAVSYHGAQKILSALSVNPSVVADEIDTGAQFDVSLGRMCGIGYIRCITSYPSLTGGYEPGGPASKFSDIHSDNTDVRGASSSGVMYSTMMNIDRLLRGETLVRSDWEDAAVPYINPDDIPVIGGEYIRFEDHVNDS